MKKTKILAALVIGATLGGLVATNRAIASDHDDGVSDAKTTNTNLTDLYVFKEQSVSSNVAHANNMVLQLLCNPRSIPTQQYFFNTNAQYDFHISKVGTGSAADEDKKNDAAVDNFTLRFTFAAPDSNKRQAMTMTAIRDGVDQGSATADTGNVTLTTSNISDDKANTPKTFTTRFAGATSDIKVYAGHRQDPFFFDVEQYFVVRNAAAQVKLNVVGADYVGFGNGAGATRTPKDAFVGYNVLAISVSIPKDFIRGTTDTTTETFDVWETVQVKS